MNILNTIYTGDWKFELDVPDEIDSRHVAEGVVARIDNRSKFTAYKRKGFMFKVISGIITDNLSEDKNISEDILNEM